MLDYKICKQLKEAGFPMSNAIGYNKDFFAIRDDQGKSWILPTLPELIRECRNKFQCLWHYSDESFEAFSGPKDQPKDYPSGKGKTAEEAVANLYLKLINYS